MKEITKPVHGEWVSLDESDPNLIITILIIQVSRPFWAPP
jgi:hypothetical protein